MSLGVASRQGSLLDDIEAFCDRTLPARSIYSLLHRERDRLFPDELFADLFSDRGRRSVPPSVVATVMVLQRLEGLSDREAVERYAFDARWRYAAGVGGYDGDGWTSFAHTVLVDFRARLAASDDPRRIFAVTLDAASEAGLVGAKRVLDSTPLYDAVASMDTVTLIRSSCSTEPSRHRSWTPQWRLPARPSSATGCCRRGSWSTTCSRSACSPMRATRR